MVEESGILPQAYHTLYKRDGRLRDSRYVSVRLISLAKRRPRSWPLHRNTCLQNLTSRNKRGHDIHVFRKDSFCWCDKEAIDILKRGTGIPPIAYVVEVEILPKKKKDERDFATIYADEMGKVFFRRNASNARPMVEEIVQCLRSEVDEYYRPLSKQPKY